MTPMPRTQPNPSQLSDALPSVPWWRVGVMWVFFVGGLGSVVVASFAMLATAIANRDTVLPHDAPPPRSNISSSTPNMPNTPNTPTSPAMQARNHAATPAR